MSEREPCPPHLDADGQQLWLMCEWALIDSRANSSVELQMQALAIRRELRLESINAGMLAALEGIIRRAKIIQPHIANVAHIGAIHEIALIETEAKAAIAKAKGA